MLIMAGGMAACDDNPNAPYRPVTTINPVTTIDPNPDSRWAYRPCNSVESNPDAPAAPNALIDGLWQGTLTNETLKTREPYTGIVAGDGRFRLRSFGHTQLVGTLAVQGDRYNGAGFAHSGGLTWHDGTLSSDLVIAGTIAGRDTLDGEFTLASGDAGCFELDYDANLYERPSSLDLIAGQWLVYDGWGWLWLSFDVSAQGEFSAEDGCGCSYAGRFRLVDSGFNLYAVDLDITQNAVFNYMCSISGNFEGLAYLADTADGLYANHYLNMVLTTSNDALRIDMHR